MVYQQQGNHNNDCTDRRPASELHRQVEEVDADVSATLGDDLRLDVTCGQNQAVLYTSRLQLGSKGTCVLFEKAWLTPNEFQYVSGRETAKDWKRSIKHHGKSLKVLIAKGILSTTSPARCNCNQCTASPQRDADSWKLSSDRTAALSSSVIATKLSRASDPWQVPSTKQSNSLALDTSAFRPPVLTPDATKPPAVSREHADDSTPSSDRCFVKKSRKRSMSPSVTSEAQSKFVRTSASQRVGSAATVTAEVDREELARDDSTQHFSADNRRQQQPLAVDYQSPTRSLHSTSTVCATTSHACLLSPSPYLPFFSATPSASISAGSGLYYPNPYMMLSSPPPPPQHFPCGWMSSAPANPSKLVADHMQHVDSYRGPAAAAAFDFPWMRANPLPTTQLSPKASHQMCGLYDAACISKQPFDFSQYMLMHNASSLGSALVPDSLDMYRQPSYELPSTVRASRMILNNQPASYFGFYPKLFHPPHLGIPSR